MKWPKPSQISGRSIRVWQRNFSIYRQNWKISFVPPLLERAGAGFGDIDFFELNEAFAAVLGGAFHDLPDLPVERTNQWGSGISLGHPVGCTGARQLVDMIHQLKRRGGSVGVAD